MKKFDDLQKSMKSEKLKLVIDNKQPINTGNYVGRISLVSCRAIKDGKETNMIIFLQGDNTCEIYYRSQNNDIEKEITEIKHNLK